MPKAQDPFYNRKPVPDELIQDVGLTGMTREQEYINREKKYTLEGGDVRNFSNPKGATGGGYDPYYIRKSVDRTMLEGVGVTGLTAEQEEMNRERKYSVSGVDVRKFGDTKNSFFEPAGDPYYNKKPVDKSAIVGVGDLNMTPAETFEKRERKLSTVQFSSDPFQQLAGTGHRESVSGAVLDSSNMATQRRRSSAAAPHAAPNAAQHHSGFDGDKLEPIESRTEGAPAPAPTTTTAQAEDRITQAGAVDSTTTHSSNATGSTQVGANGIHDPDSVDPHDTR